MKAAILAFVGVASAHDLSNEQWFTDNSLPADYYNMAAIGETYHNAWKRCRERTTTWLNEELELSEVDPTFDNSYYALYKIEERVPRVYN